MRLGNDNEFGLLLRDLRALVGTEALLAVAQDLATIRFLLALAAHHADAAATRARWVLTRIALSEEGGET